MALVDVALNCCLRKNLKASYAKILTPTPKKVLQDAIEMNT